MKKLFFLIWLLPAVCIAQTDTTTSKAHIIYCKLGLGGNPIFKTIVKADFGKKQVVCMDLKKNLKD
ncbi:MAG: hypothetical protein ACRYFL_11865 [Janthinobacterium lividum]